MMRYILQIFAAFALLPVWVAAHANELPFPVEAASYLVRVNDQVRWERAVEQKLPPASLTKIMSVLLVLENYQPQKVVSVSVDATRETGTRLGLKIGERMRVKELLAASLLDSANDACHALADHVAGDEQHFVKLMNQRAQEWGLEATHFTNACGHDDELHYSSVQDLVVLADMALANPVFADLVAKHTLIIRSADGSRSFKLENSNALIGRYPGTIGVKTGYTDKAGKCLIALVERSGVNVLLIMLHASDRWWDASDILDYAFSKKARHVP